jgi:hypothetical protein
VEAVRFEGQVRYWKPEQPGGLAVVDVPGDDAARLGGLRQQKVRGTIGSAPFASSVMPAGGGRLAMSVSKAMLKAAGAGVGDTVRVVITGVGRE